MKTLEQYIGRNVLLGMALVLLVLGGLDLLFSVVDEMGGTNERYDGMAALQYVLLIFPGHVYELLPMTALIGALIGLGILAGGNELMVMQASGVAVRRIVWAVMKPAFVVMLAGLILGEFMVPALELKAEQHKSIANGEDIGLSGYGYWTRDGESFVHFTAIDADGILHNLSILDFNDRQWISRSIEAARAVYQDTGFWQLDSGRTISFSYGEGDAMASTVEPFDSRRWEGSLTPDLLRVLILDADMMPMSDLLRYARRFESQGQDAAPYFLSFWKKVLQPVTTAMLVLVAVSFIFGPLREATTGSRVFTAICFGLAFTIVQRLMHNLSLVYQLPPVLGVIGPLLLLGLVGLLLFRRVA